MVYWGYSSTNDIIFGSENTDTEKYRRDYIPVSQEPNNRVIDIARVREHLKLNVYNAQGESFYEGLIDAATGVAEHYMRREVVTKKFKTYVNKIGKDGIQIRKASLKAITAITYLDVDNVWQTLPTDNYYFTESNFYSTVFKTGDDFPDIRYDREQTVKLEITVGWPGETIPEDVKLAILNHVAVLNEQRGDWGSADMGLSRMIQTIPSFSKAVYGKYRIQNR